MDVAPTLSRRRLCRPCPASKWRSGTSLEEQNRHSVVPPPSMSSMKLRSHHALQGRRRRRACSAGGTVFSLLENTTCMSWVSQSRGGSKRGTNRPTLLFGTDSERDPNTLLTSKSFTATTHVSAPLYQLAPSSLDLISNTTLQWNISSPIYRSHFVQINIRLCALTYLQRFPFLFASPAKRAKYLPDCKTTFVPRWVGNGRCGEYQKKHEVMPQGRSLETEEHGVLGCVHYGKRVEG